MANEATIKSSLAIKVGNIDYRSFPSSYQADVGTGNPNGPVPGAMVVTTIGVVVDLSTLTTPGLCRMENYDTTNYVTYGVYDGIEFYPWGEIMAGEGFTIRLSRLLGTSLLGTAVGTGTYDTGTYQFYMKADTASCNCTVEAFEK